MSAHGDYSFFALIYLSGCTTALTKEGQKVFAFQGRENNTCEFLNSIEGDAICGNNCHQSAAYDLLNKTAKMGGNAVKVNSMSGNQLKVIISGEAFKCQSFSEMSPADSATVPSTFVNLDPMMNQMQKQYDQNRAEEQAQRNRNKKTQCVSRPTYDGKGNLLRTDTECQ